jgi:hypothetical protein
VALQRLCQIALQVRNRFEANRDANQGLGDPGALAIGGRDAAV